MMENQEFNPPPIQNAPRLKFVYVLVVILVLFFGGIGGYLLGTKKTSAPAPTLAPKTTIKYPVATSSGETAGWKTFTNSVYHYSITTPGDFILKLCSDCNPPEVNFSLQNNSKTITIGASYAAQWSLTANMSSKPTTVKNLKVVIQGKKYDPEEYFDNDNKRYIFKIDDVEINSRSSQISLSGNYQSLDDATLVSDILSTFKFLGQNQASLLDWMTYSDSQYKFEFKAPPYFKKSSHGGPAIFGFSLVSDKNDMTIDFDIMKMGDNDLYKWAIAFFPDIKNIKTSVRNGILLVEFEKISINNNIKNKYFIFSLGGNAYLFNFNIVVDSANIESEINQILGTFKFL